MFLIQTKRRIVKLQTVTPVPLVIELASIRLRRTYVIISARDFYPYYNIFVMYIFVMYNKKHVERESLGIFN